MDVEISGKGVITMPRPASKKSRRAKTYNPNWAERIKAFRRLRGLTQAELADRVGISQRAISAYEMATCRLPAEVLLKLSQAFRVSVYELANGKTPPPPPPKNGRQVRAVVEKLETLPPKKQREAINYIEYLATGQRVA